MISGTSADCGIIIAIKRGWIKECPCAGCLVKFKCVDDCLEFNDIYMAVLHGNRSVINKMKKRDKINIKKTIKRIRL